MEKNKISGIIIKLALILFVIAILLLISSSYYSDYTFYESKIIEINNNKLKVIGTVESGDYTYYEIDKPLLKKVNVGDIIHYKVKDNKATYSFFNSANDVELIGARILMILLFSALIIFATLLIVFVTKGIINLRKISK